MDEFDGKKFALLPLCHSLPYTCYEVGHTWTPHCHMATLQTARDSILFSLKVYTTFYGGTGLLKLLKKKNRKNWKKFLVRQVLAILQSSIFLASNGTGYMAFFCIHRHIFRKFYRWHGGLAGFSTGLFSIMLERKERRVLLATYVSNLALETLFQMGKTRNYVKGINNGQVIIFSIASAGFMSLLRTPHGLSAYLQSPLEFFVGKDESAKLETPQENTDDDNESEKKKPNLFSSVAQKSEQILSYVIRNFCKQLPSDKHHSCNHRDGCLHYCIEGFVRQFMVGYLAELLLNLLKVIRSRKGFMKIFRSRKLAMFLGTFVGLFRFCNCLLRWLCGGDYPAVNGLVSGLVAGSSFYFYKSTTIALYFLCKLIEILMGKGVNCGYLPNIPHADALIYSLALSVVLSAAWIEPHNIRPGYWKFLLGVSGNRFPEMFRFLTPEFLPDQKTMYMDFIPNLEAKYIKSEKVLELLKRYGKI